jgi:hypothetical protein
MKTVTPSVAEPQRKHFGQGGTISGIDYTTAAGRVGLCHCGIERRESEVAKAQRIVGEELERLGWTGRDWETSSKGHPEKFRIARRLYRRRSRIRVGSWGKVES